MSLRDAAQYLAAHGRGGDTMLAHINPREAALLKAHGGSGTINPHTGLPEFFDIEQELGNLGEGIEENVGIIAPIAAAIYAPELAALYGMESAGLAAALTAGGATAALTGSLQKGVMAGLGAYGGAQLTGAAGAGLESAAAAKEAAAANAYMSGLEAVPETKMTLGESFKAAMGPQGLGSLSGKQLATSGLMAAAPLLASQTRTKMPGADGAGGAFTPTSAIHPKYAYRDQEGNVRFIDLPGVRAKDWDPTRSVSDYVRSLVAEPRYAAEGGVIGMADGGSTDLNRQISFERPSIKEFRKATGVDFKTASDLLYGVVGSGDEKRNWSAIMASSDPVAAARQATADMYGGVKQGVYVDPKSGESFPQLFSNTGINLTQAGTGRDINFGVGLQANPDSDLIYGLATGRKPPTTGGGTGGGGTGGGGTGGGGTGGGGTGGDSLPTGFYGGENTPGDITRNPDNTVTVTPNIPGRPTGGFAGMEEVRDAYTKGGGSLGQTLAPTREYKNTGQSAAAYDYLMGQGAYPTYTQAPKLAANTFVDINKPTDTELAANASKLYVWQDGQRINNPHYGKTSGATTTTTTTTPTPEPPPGGARGGLIAAYAAGGLPDAHYNLGGYSDGGRLLRGPGDGVSDSIPATIGRNRQPARLADGEFVVPARIVSELGNGSTEAGARKLYAMMDRIQKARSKTVGKGKVAKNTRADKHLPA